MCYHPHHGPHFLCTLASLDWAANDARAPVAAAVTAASAGLRFRNFKFDGTNPPIVVSSPRTPIGSIKCPLSTFSGFHKAPSAWANASRIPCRRTVRFSGIRGATDNRAAKTSPTLTLPRRTWEGIKTFAATAQNDQNDNPFSLYNSAPNVVTSVRQNGAEIHGSAVSHINPLAKAALRGFRVLTFYWVQGSPLPPVKKPRR